MVPRRVGGPHLRRIQSGGAPGGEDSRAAAGHGRGPTTAGDISSPHCPPGSAPVSQPSASTLWGWVLREGNASNGRHGLTTALDAEGEEAPRKTEGGCDCRAVRRTPREGPQVEPAEDAVGNGTALRLESLPEGASDGAPPTPSSSVPPSALRQLLPPLLAGRTLGWRGRFSLQLSGNRGPGSDSGHPAGGRPLARGPRSGQRICHAAASFPSPTPGHCLHS